jgi:iron complex transport system ATP-binding protein
MQLSFQHIELGYGLIKLLVQPFSAEVNQSERIGIMGLNGSGKSTLLNALTGFTPLLSGEIAFDGTSVMKASALQRAKWIARVFTRYENPGLLKVWDVIALGRNPYRNRFQTLTLEDTQLMQEVAMRLKIQHLTDRYFNELSDGERQLVMVATASVQQTPVLALDEPDAHLDLRNQNMLIDMLCTINRLENTTLLYSTHNPEWIRQLATRVWLFDGGKILDMSQREFIENKAWERMLS